MIAPSAATVLMVLLAGSEVRPSPRSDPRPDRAASAAGAGLRGCTGPSIVPDGWQVTCGGAMVSIADDPGAGYCAPDECVEVQVRSWSETFGALDRNETRVALAGEPRRLIRLDAGQGADRGRVLIADLRLPEGLRILTCAGAPEDEPRCLDALEALARLGWRAGIPSFIPRAPARFLGRSYDVPPGCTAFSEGDAEGGVSCGPDSTLLWSTSSDPDADERATLEPYGRMALTETRVPCAIAGEGTTCRSLRASDGKKVRIDVGHARVRGKTVVVSCFDWTGKAGVPRACAGVLTSRGEGASAR